MKKTKYIVPTQQIYSFSVTHLCAGTDSTTDPGGGGFGKGEEGGEGGGGAVNEESLYSYNVWDEQW